MMISAWVTTAAIAAALSATPDAPRILEAPDRGTLQTIHDANQTAIQVGQLARDKAGASKAVRDLGRRLAVDHAAAEKRISALLQARGADARVFASTTSADPDHELLATKSGTEFDRAFALQVIADDTKLIERLESARLETADGGLRDFYDGFLPIVQAHKRAAQDIVVTSARS
ncbi:MAG TPA: DUF4142 domain-containing protein [Polyangia bacterium]|nr:DUF4142 domain-containing protein [Polyangia bacterium]